MVSATPKRSAASPGRKDETPWAQRDPTQGVSFFVRTLLSLFVDNSLFQTKLLNIATTTATSAGIIHDRQFCHFI